MDGVNSQPQEPGARDPAPGELRTAQLFLNSNNIEAGVDQLASPEEASRWLADHGLASEASVIGSDDDLERLIDFREGIRALLASDHDNDQITGEDLERLTSSFAGITASFRFDGSGDVQLIPTGNGLDAVVARLGLIVHQAQLTGLWRRFKVCSDDGCRWAFWDSSRNCSGRWCSMALCGNQAKVRAHRQRTHRGPGRADEAVVS